MKKFLSIFLILILNLVFLLRLNSQNEFKIQILGNGPLYDDLCFPYDIAIDSQNRIYVADRQFPYIKVFDKDGNFLFNFGSFGEKEGEFIFPFAIDVDRVNNRIAVIDYLKRFSDENRVQIFDLNGKFLFELKEFRDEKFGDPIAVEYDNNGNLFVLCEGDKDLKTVKIFDKDGKLIKEIIDYKYIDGAKDFAVNQKNNKIYILSTPQWTNQKVHIFNMDGGYYSYFTKSDFYWPDGIDIDEDGLVYVANDGQCTVEIFDSDGKFIKNFGGRGIITSYNLRPRRLSVFNKIVSVADAFNGRVNNFTNEGMLISQIGTSKNLTDLFNYPTDVDVDSKGNIYVVDFGKMKVSKFDKNYTPILSFGGYSESKKLNSLLWPWSIFILSDNEIFITNYYSYGGPEPQKIKKFDSKGVEQLRFGGAGNKSNQYEGPSGICGDKYGNLYIADYGNSRVQKVKSNGDFLKIFEIKDEDFGPIDVAVDSNLNLYALNPNNNKIIVFNKDGEHIKTFNERATGIFIDDLDRIWITNPDIGNYPIKILDTDGNIIKQFGSVGGPVTIGNVLSSKEDYLKFPGKFFYPIGLTLKGDYLYVVDSGNKRVQKIPLKLIFQDLSISLKSPNNNEVIYEDKYNFSWNINEDLNNQYYEIEISDNENFGNIIFKKGELSQKDIEIDLKIFDKNRNYYWRVRSYNDLFYGNWSDIYKFRIENIIPPNEPIIKGEIVDNKIKLTWSKPADGTFPILGYEIYRGESEDNFNLIQIVDKDITSYVDENIEYNKTYYYKIRCFDDYKIKNYSSFSNIINIKISDMNPPKIYLSIPEETNTQTIYIEGSVSDDLSGIKDNSIFINGIKVSLTKEFKFNFRIELNEGLNNIKIEVIDNAGNKLSKTYQIKYVKNITLKLQIGNRIMIFNGIEKEIDVPPQIIEGRTYLPIKYIVEPLGGEVSWDGNEKKVTITLKDTTIELWIGKNFAKVNGVYTPIDSNNSKVVPMIIQGRTMLPVRFVAENLGCEVLWDSISKTITINYP